MKLETFFEKFEQLVDVPDAVAALRELIVQWAVRGRLANQSQNESASALVFAAREAKTRKKGAKKGVWLSDNAVSPFPIPPNWKWLCVGDAIDMINGRAFKSTEWSDEGLPIIRIQNLNNPFAQYNFFEGDYDEKHFVTSGSFLISWSGTPGTSFGAFIWDREDGLLNQHIFKCEMYSSIITKEYLKLAVNARLDEIISHAQGGVGLRHITKGKLEKISLPLPPLAEQERIVMKVNELMGLCDQLEAQLQERSTMHTKLAPAALARFVDAPTPENLNFLFHKSYDIAPSDLRKTILTLAVHGKLVPQEPNDEPAEAILRRIHSVYRSESGAKYARSSESLEELPFDLPSGWAVSRLGSILDPKRGISYGVIKLGVEPQQGGVPILRCSNVRFRRIDLKGIRKVSENLSAEYGRTILEGGEVLINVRGTLGGCAVVPSSLKGFNVAREVAVIPVHSEIDAMFLLNIIASPYFQDRVKENLRGIAYAGLNLGLLRNFLIPLPPFAEQRRIVTKVEQLMALVDELEAQLAFSRNVSKKLLEAIIIELTTAGVSPSKVPV